MFHSLAMNYQGLPAERPQGQDPPCYSSHALPELTKSKPAAQPTFASVPGLSANNMLSSQAAFDHNRTTIPGLSFATPGWPSASQLWQTGSVAAPAQAPTNPVPSWMGIKAQLDRSCAAPEETPITVQPPPAQSSTATTAQATTTSVDDGGMEEGELSESAFEDLYEPYLDPTDTANAADQPSHDPPTEEEDYDPAKLASPGRDENVPRSWPNEIAAASPPTAGKTTQRPET